MISELPKTGFGISDAASVIWLDINFIKTLCLKIFGYVLDFFFYQSPLPQ